MMQFPYPNVFTQTPRLGGFQLGPNDRPENGIYRGDARVLSKSVPDTAIDLVIADMPYFGIADADWDKQWNGINKWADWCYEWSLEVARILKQNGSFYVFGDEKNLSYVQVRLDRIREWGLLNRIVWAKTNYTMRKASPEALRSYQVEGEEHILFYGKDITFPSFSEIRNPKAALPMAQYLRAERLRAGVSAKELAVLFPSKTGGLTGCISNWELGYNFPLKEQYEKMREYLNNGKREYLREEYEYLREEYEYLREEYEYLREEYEDLREEYEYLRRPFYGGKFTDIWRGPLEAGSKKVHISQKPLWIIERIILCSSKPGDTVVDMFCGSGVVPLACKRLGRRYLAFEIDADMVKNARNRVRDTNPPLFVVEPEQLKLPDTA
jgi:adenine-specific DNA-methyltransferase